MIGGTTMVERALRYHCRGRDDHGERKGWFEGSSMSCQSFEFLPPARTFCKNPCSWAEIVGRLVHWPHLMKLEY